MQENEGVTEVTRMEEALTAYAGMKLEQEDDVYVTEDSNMIMQLDDDKYVFAEENTKFHLEVSGKKNNGKVKICLSEGSVLVEIQNKLSIYNSINYRIYRSWEDLESYHINGLRKLKDGISI